MCDIDYEYWPPPDGYGDEVPPIKRERKEKDPFHEPAPGEENEDE